MKTLQKSIIVLLILLSNLVTAQLEQGINYKALVKDNSGSILTNQDITVQFTILKGTAQTQVHQENYTTTTDGNGIIILTIGEGVPLGDIILNDDDYFLKVQIDTGNGLVDMGTSQFRTVPYAINASQANFAQNAAMANNVTGLEKITENNKMGWRLINQNPDKYGDIGANAIDLSIGLNDSNTEGALGDISTALGYQTTASGNVSTAMGNSTTASGISSTALGYITKASGEKSIAMGNRTTAYGIASTAMGSQTTSSGSNSVAQGYSTIASGVNSLSTGLFTKAESFASTAIGLYNVGGGNPTQLVDNDPLLEVGNGLSNTTRQNAFTVFKNGNATLSGSLSQNSDKRLKTHVKDLKYGLDEVLKLRPVAYHWKKYPNQKQKSLGLIAQEVQPILKELIHTAKDKDKTLSLSYTELIPVLINAIKEQQQIIDTQQTQLNSQHNSTTALLERIVALENSNGKNNPIKIATIK